MSLDPKITDTLLFGQHYGDRLCMEQRSFTAFVWNDEWLVIADQLGQFGGREIKHVAVQFCRRPERQRYVVKRAEELEAA